MGKAAKLGKLKAPKITRFPRRERAWSLRVQFSADTQTSVAFPPSGAVSNASSTLNTGESLHKAGSNETTPPFPPASPPPPQPEVPFQPDQPSVLEFSNSPLPPFGREISNGGPLLDRPSQLPPQLAGLVTQPRQESGASGVRGPAAATNPIYSGNGDVGFASNSEAAYFAMNPPPAHGDPGTEAGTSSDFLHAGLPSPWHDPTISVTGSTPISFANLHPSSGHASHGVNTSSIVPNHGGAFHSGGNFGGTVAPRSFPDSAYVPLVVA